MGLLGYCGIRIRQNGSVIGRGYEDVDLSLFKNIAVWERPQSQLRLEAFNTLNHTNFSTISTTTSATNYGQVTGTGAARVLQIAAKLTI